MWNINQKDFVCTCKCNFPSIVDFDYHVKASNPTPDGNFQQKCIKQLDSTGKGKSFCLYLFKEMEDKGEMDWLCKVYTDLPLFFKTLREYIKSEAYYE